MKKQVMTKQEKQRMVLENTMRTIIRFFCKKEFTAVLHEDGKPTDNTFPLGFPQEKDAKTPQEWINGIMFDWELRGMKTNLTLIAMRLG